MEIELKEVQNLIEKIGKENGEKIQQTVNEAVMAAAKEFITGKQLSEKLDALGVDKKAIDELTKAVEKQGMEILKFSKGEQSSETVYDKLQKHGKEISDLAESKSGTISFKVNKAIVNRATVTNNTMGFREAEIGVLPYKGLVFENLWPTVTMSEADVAASNGVIRYMDQSAKTRNAAPTAESGTKPESAITWVERTTNLEVIANHIPVTKQAYRQLSFVAGEVDTLLRENLAITRDTQLYRGDGISPNLRGILTAAGAALVPSSLPNFGQLVDANLYDLIANCRVRISSSKQSKYSPNVVVMNPADILRYKLAKGADGHYILPPFVSANGMQIDGIQVVESSEVTANTMIIGDFTKGRIYRSENVNITMGLIANQFINNQWTILAEEEMALRIRDVDADGYLFVSDITVAIAALNIA